jgi:hypothetical protein
MFRYACLFRSSTFIPPYSDIRQTLRVDRFNEGRPTRCLLCYSGIHYDTIVQSPSDPPHMKANLPPEFDKRIWDADDEDIVSKAQDLCKMLQERHYFTDTGGMPIKCEICGWVSHHAPGLKLKTNGFRSVPGKGKHKHMLNKLGIMICKR